MNNSILLVEDQALDLELTLIAFGRCKMDHDLVVVRNGQEALDYLSCQDKYADREWGNPSLIILDLNTPNLSGLQVLDAVRNCQSTREIPVVILTNSRDPEAERKAQELDVTAYIFKPLAIDEFVAAVAELGALRAAWALRPELKPTQF